MSLAILTPLSQRPNKDTDRRRWNESWERDLRSSYSNIGKLNSTVRLSPQARQHGQSLTADSQLELYYERTTRDILDLQKDLREKASLKLGTDNLAQKWRELTLQRREALVLEGLYRASSAGQDMEGHRKWCPDLTLRTLSGNGGQGFINLLQQFVPENLDQARVATTPIMISHSGVNQLLRLESFAFLARGYRLHRCYFMTMTLWRILLALCGEDEGYVYAKMPSEPSPSSKAQVRRDLRSVIGDEEYRQFRGELKERRMEQIKVCWNCGKDATRLESGQELKSCAGCKKIGRTILYCSRECQVDDWKNETRPHKGICGKPFSTGKTL